ncbi:MAG: class II fumarate hydratase [Flavobacteriaceae bacterium]|nr:class II fumarate hydratase [Flavobacteriaceae bacterium]
MKSRIEKDTLGEINVPIDALWGAQTERSRKNFRIGPSGSMPIEIIHGLAIVKKAAAYTNNHFGLLSEFKRDLIAEVCDEILTGKLNNHFPLVIWQTGSGTQTNMNVNEVIANKALLNQNKQLGKNKPILSPNDDVNKSQSSNDTFPSAIHIAVYKTLHERTIPGIQKLIKAIDQKSTEFKGIVKIGRTHLMDATPLTLEQEFSGYLRQLETGLNLLEYSLNDLSELAIGGTAVGTGLNTPKGFDKIVAKHIAEFTKLPFKTAQNKFEALSSHDALVGVHGGLKKLAISLNKIANDIRMLASGPRSGLGELILPSNEPGSSIMPGKINPTQCEALTMVCGQIIGNDVAVSFGGAQGHFQLNVFKPLIGSAVLESSRLLGDVCHSFADNCISGIMPNKKRIKELVDNSLMLVTALNPKIGYYKAAEIAQKAHNEETSLKQACISLGYLTSKEFDTLVQPEQMTKPDEQPN